MSVRETIRSAVFAVCTRWKEELRLICVPGEEFYDQGKVIPNFFVLYRFIVFL